MWTICWSRICYVIYQSLRYYVHNNVRVVDNHDSDLGGILRSFELPTQLLYPTKYNENVSCLLLTIQLSLPLPTRSCFTHSLFVSLSAQSIKMLQKSQHGISEMGEQRDQKSIRFCRWYAVMHWFMLIRQQITLCTFTTPAKYSVCLTSVNRGKGVHSVNSFYLQIGLERYQKSHPIHNTQ